VNITVIICTRDRCQILPQALDSIAASTLPETTAWEVLVVDNNSADQTRDVVEEFCRRYPGRFRYSFEPQIGKSFALNAGIREAQGEILAFTDDDVTVENSWLQNLTAPLHDIQCAGVGGCVVLQWPASLPNWLSIQGRFARHCFPGFDHGPEAKELVWPPSGANVAYRKSLFAKFGGFRTDLGPSSTGDVPRLAEDTEFGRRLILAGKHLGYEPSATVFHPVPAAQLNREYFLAWWFDKGRAFARYSRISRASLTFNLGARTLRWILSVNPAVRFSRKLVVWEQAGSLAELRHQSSEAKKKKAMKAEVARKNVEAIKRDKLNRLGLKAGEWVEVRTVEEILATLDDRGGLGNLPFMPEMLQYCGRQFRVFRRADKSCDNIEPWSIRRMTNAVLLEGLRCDGQGHGGCQTGCMIFWKEAWLKRTTKDVVSRDSLRASGDFRSGERGLIKVADILSASSRMDASGETIYTCQATEVLNFTSYMWSWDPRHYIRDLTSRNLSTGLAGDSRAHRALEFTLGILRIFRAITISFFNTIQTKRSRRPTYPYLGGTASKVPIEVLNLQPGELVQIRSREEIIATLDKDDRHRGLLFDGAMFNYSGGIYRVLGRIHKIIDEKTGKMLFMKNPCIVLEGVVCAWDYHRLCPRSTCTPYWRENWLKRAVHVPAPRPAGEIAETCGKS
jgi:glycosyltransferase involved in cell wall biosynthesis